MWQIIKHTIQQVRRDRIFRILLSSFFVGLCVVIALSFLVLDQQKYVFTTFVISLAEILIFLRILFAVSTRYTTHKDQKFFVLYYTNGISPSKVYVATSWGYILMVCMIYVFIWSIASIAALLFDMFTISLVVSLLASMIKILAMLVTVLTLSVVVRQLVAIIWTVVVYILAHSTSFIHQLAQNTESSILSIVYKGVYVVLPPFDYLSYIDQYLQNSMLSFSVVMHIIFYIFVIRMIWYSMLSKKII